MDNEYSFLLFLPLVYLTPLFAVFTWKIIFLDIWENLKKGFLLPALKHSFLIFVVLQLWRKIIKLLELWRKGRESCWSQELHSFSCLSPDSNHQSLSVIRRYNSSRNINCTWKRSGRCSRERTLFQIQNF